MIRECDGRLRAADFGSCSQPAQGVSIISMTCRCLQDTRRRRQALMPRRLIRTSSFEVNSQLRTLRLDAALRAPLHARVIIRLMTTRWDIALLHSRQGRNDVRRRHKQ